MDSAEEFVWGMIVKGINCKDFFRLITLTNIHLARGRVESNKPSSAVSMSRHH
jgi:hypothetical protein